MKSTVFFFCLLGVLLFSIQAGHSSTLPTFDPDKPTDHLRTNEVWDSRDGGETIDDAIFMVLPFMDTGATCDNINDYDEVCPYIGSTAPDVVYSFNALSGDILWIDLCGSGYDTKVYVYDEFLNIIGCNDDFYDDDACGQYVSAIEQLPIESDGLYYLVVDGYGSDCGGYNLSVQYYCLPPPCIDAQCPDDGIAENEPALYNGYVDEFNSGCNSTPPVFQELTLPPGQEELNLCGQTGWYTTDGVDLKDEDWYVLVASGDNILVETNSSHFLPTECDVLFLDDCQDISLWPYIMGVCDSGIINIPTQPGDVVFLRVRPYHDTQQECARREDLYTLKITGIGDMVVDTDNVEWDSLKSMFR